MKHASRPASGAKVEARNGQGLDSWRPMQYAQGFGGVFEVRREIEIKCMNPDEAIVNSFAVQC